MDNIGKVLEGGFNKKTVLDGGVYMDTVLGGEVFYANTVLERYI
jgi:hypothetical protein